ncbi:hypothetical protein PHYBOEH_007998 [Phytophthora boehmeriae]|uniref:Uncharacterized protein n=1 Tax=Phytophthora boehmeriae TaxID=109152 RepID=A0A8T1W942_9STRA|nr:hypothetical protein PHYBOEH_007998 [Phytophthora boehmeriae]
MHCRSLRLSSRLLPHRPTRFNSSFASRNAASSIQHLRHFASSSPPQDSDPPIGLQEILTTLSKVKARKDVFQKYKQQDVFAPSGMSWLANWLMFYHLNRPQQTQLDLIEFLEGAKYAMEATMTAMYSREFADYVRREAAAPGALQPDCATAEMVQRSLESVSYEAFKAFVLQSSSVGIRAEMQKIEMHSAHLLSVQYQRIAKRPTTNLSGAKILGVPINERLKLAVLFDITEHVNVALPEEEIQDELTIRRTKAIWQFESNVTTAEDIDWIIEPLHLVA